MPAPCTFPAVRRSTPFLVVLGLLFVACANSSTPEGGGGGVISDAGTADEAPNYGDDDAGTVEDTGAPEQDAGKTDSGLAIYDAGSTPDTGTGTGNGAACDDSDGSYSIEYALALSFGASLGLCSDGCKSDECCFDPGIADPVCLK